MCPYDCEYYARLATRRMCTAWKILHRTFKAFKPPVKRSVVRKEGVYGVAGFHGTKLLGEDIVQNPCVSYKSTSIMNYAGGCFCLIFFMIPHRNNDSLAIASTHKSPVS